MSERQLGWAGLFLGVIGLVLSVAALVRESLAIGLVGLALVAVALLALFLLYLSSKKLGDARRTLEEPPITLRHIQKVIRFEDRDAARATHTDRRTVRVNHATGPTHYWFKNLAPVDKLDNILIDGSAPDARVPEAHVLRVGKHYSYGFDRGDEFTVQLSLDWLNAYPDDKEFHIHMVLDDTEKMNLHIIFHPERPYRNPKVLKGPGPGAFKVTTDANVTMHNNELEVEVENPEVCQQYYIEWEW